MSREMKDSGVAWIGDMPHEWAIVPNKRLMRKKKVIRSNYNGEAVLSLSINGVIARDLDNPSGKMPTTFDGYQYVEKGNLLMCLFDIDVTPRCIGLIKSDGICSPAYSQFVLNEDVNPEFYYYYYLNLDHTKELLHLAKNLRHSLTEEQFGLIPTAYPPLRVQETIVKILNKKLYQIDSLLANQQKQVEKLKQYKQSLITEVVTKGLNPNAEMKNSGIEWIGEICENHSVERLKFSLSAPMMYGANSSGTQNQDDAVRYIRITDITTDSKLKDDENNLYLPLYEAENYLLNDGDVLFARSGGTVGKTFVYYSKYGESAFAGYLIKAECDKDKLLPEFLFYYTQSSLYETWKNMIFIQATIQNIGANKYSNMEIISMDIEQQKKIVSYLSCACNKIDSLITIKEQKIEKLQQYKKSLIYEYVTGKKEVL